MRINTNISAINSYRHLAENQRQVATSLQKLSSGQRINRAADDAAGLSISEKMRGQIRGLGQAARNAQDGISMVQTAESGASIIHDMLQRGRELAVQAANGTLTDSDRLKAQEEIDQLLQQIDKTADNTEFNTIKLLNQASSPYPGISQAALNQLTAQLPGWINDSMTAVEGQLGIDVPAGTRPMAVQYYYDSVSTTGASMGTSDGGASLTLRVNVAKFFDGSGNLQPTGVLDTLIAHELVHAHQFTNMAFSTDGANSATEQWFLEGLAMTIQGGNLFPATDQNVSLVAPFDGDYRSAYEAVKVLHEITNGGITSIIDRLEAGETLDQAFANTTQDIAGTELAGAAGFADFADTTSFVNWFNANTGSAITNYIGSSNDFSQGSGAITTGNSKGSNSNLTLDQTITNGTGTALLNAHFTLNFVNSTASAAPDSVFQIGANTGQTLGFSTADLRTTTMGLAGVQVTTEALAQQAIGVFDAGIQLVSTARSYFGAIQNRLEHTITNLSNSEENLTAAESRIRDMDMAKEMMTFSKSNIISQAATAMLAQANQQPQGVLQLVRSA